MLLPDAPNLNPSAYPVVRRHPSSSSHPPSVIVPSSSRHPSSTHRKMQSDLVVENTRLRAELARANALIHKLDGLLEKAQETLASARQIIEMLTAANVICVDLLQMNW